jgi:nucleotide-binding universal stress UspA family protein
MGAKEIGIAGMRTGSSNLAARPSWSLGYQGWVVGGVTEKVVNHAESPLLIIRAC